MGPRALAALLAPVPAYFCFRIASGLLLLKLSASFLSVDDFATFMQFLLFASLLNMVAVGGTQNGLIRQAAAASDAEALARTQTAALVIWSACVPALLLPIAIASPFVSTILAGTSRHWPVVVCIATLALVAGPGQIWCSILSGRKRVAQSLAAQAGGLTTGTALAAWQIGVGNGVAAAIGFSAGSLVTMAASFRFSGRLRIGLTAPRSASAEVRTLLRYSGALAATTGFTAMTLFGLRSFYRDAFGATALGYWLAANRISDMSTQLLGLFMIQFFVPHAAVTESEEDRRTLVVRCWAAATGMILTGIAIFSMASVPLVRLFLSESFVPAIPAIRTYMIGDAFRVCASLAMFAAFARGRPGVYAGIEIATISVMAIIAVALISLGEASAPQLAYVTAYGITAVAVAISFFWSPNRRQATV